MTNLLKKFLGISLSAAVFLTSSLFFAAVAEASYAIDDFEGYADQAALESVWKIENNYLLTVNTDATYAQSGSSLKLDKNGQSWGGIYTRNNDLLAAPSDAAGVGLWVYSPVDSMKLKLQFQYNWKDKYSYIVPLKAGENWISLSMSGWNHDSGEGDYAATELGVVNQLYLEITEGTYCYVDNIRYLTQSEVPDPYRINNFENYADQAALEGAWDTMGDSTTRTLDTAVSKSGKSMKIAYNGWGSVYMQRLSEGLVAPTDAAGLGIWVKSSAATSNLAIRLIYGTDEFRWKLPVKLTEGVNELKLSFDDAAWERASGGWGDTTSPFPGKNNITSIQFESAGGEYTLNVDDIRFLAADEIGGGDTPPSEVPEQPTLPSDPYKLDDFEGYANNASLGYGNLWVNNSGGTCTATLTLEKDAGNVQAGSALKISATDGGWMTITRGGVTIPQDATSMTFWAKAAEEVTLNLEFRLNNDDYKYVPANGIKIGTEGALYTVYFEDLAYLPGGGSDKGWLFNGNCLVNAINFCRDGYNAVTLYIDDISFGKESKPDDPNDPIKLLEKGIDELPQYDDLTVLDIDSIEKLYTAYSALSAADKKLVSNRQALLDAKELLDSWEAVLGDKLDTVRKLAQDIDDLPDEVTEADKETVNALWSIYKGLTDEQKALVPGAAALETAWQALNNSPATGAAVSVGAGVMAMLAAGLTWASRKKNR